MIVIMYSSDLQQINVNTKVNEFFLKTVQTASHKHISDLHSSKWTSTQAAQLHPNANQTQVLVDNYS